MDTQRLSIRLWSYARLGTIVLGVLAFATVRSTRADAQSQRANVTVIVLGKIPAPGGRALVVRRAGVKPENLIVLQRGVADPEDLIAALGVLSVEVQHAPSYSGVGESRSSVTAANLVSQLNPGREQRIRQLIRNLSKISPREIAGFGYAPAIDMPIPNAHAHAK